jgi:hypothetical protein
MVAPSVLNSAVSWTDLYTMFLVAAMQQVAYSCLTDCREADRMPQPTWVFLYCLEGARRP